jgi:hypothetical protein
MLGKRKALGNGNEITDKRLKSSKQSQPKCDKPSNTLFNYFKSTKTNEEINDEKPSNTLFNYFKSTKSSEVKTNEEIIVENKKEEVNSFDECEITSIIKTDISVKIEESKITVKTDDCNKQAWSKIFAKTEKIEIKQEIKPETNELDSIIEATVVETKKFTRKCPFYKFIQSNFEKHLLLNLN